MTASRKDILCFRHALGPQEIAGNQTNSLQPLLVQEQKETNSFKHGKWRDAGQQLPDKFTEYLVSEQCHYLAKKVSFICFKTP